MPSACVQIAWHLKLEDYCTANNDILGGGVFFPMPALPVSKTRPSRNSSDCVQLVINFCVFCAPRITLMNTRLPASIPRMASVVENGREGGNDTLQLQ